MNLQLIEPNPKIQNIYHHLKINSNHFLLLRQ